MGKQLLLLGLIIFLASSSAVPETVYGINGSSYTFVCPHKKTPRANVLWQFTNKSGCVFGVSEDTLIFRHYPANDRVEISGNSSNGEYNLKLSALQETDEGFYACYVSTRHKSYNFELLIDPFSLVIYDEVNSEIVGTEGMSLTINCTAVGGVPEPDLWLEVDSQVVIGKQSVSYIIPELHRYHDKQLVKCQATRSEMEQAANLYLYLKPSVPVFNTDRPRTNEAQHLIISCTSTGSRPAGVIYWKINSTVVKAGFVQQNTSDFSTDTYTTISTLTYRMDRSYTGLPITCGVTHQALQGIAEDTKTIHVYYPPDVNVNDVTYNHSEAHRTVTCNPEGDPATYTYYTWQHKSKYGVPIRKLDGGQDGILTLSNVPELQRYQDTGEYVCKVGNGIMGTTGNVQQKGYGYVTVNAQPVFTKDNDNSPTQYGEIGKHIDIYIYVYSVPKYTAIKWSKYNRKIFQSAKYDMTDVAAIVHHEFHGSEVQLDGYRVALTINLLTLEDFSNYTLELFNGYDQPVKRAVVLESLIAPETHSVTVNTTKSECNEFSESECNEFSNRVMFVVGLTLAISTLLYWGILGSIYYRRKLTARRHRVSSESERGHRRYENAVASRDTDRQEYAIPEIQLELHEGFGINDKPYLYDEVGTNSSEHHNGMQHL